VLAILAAAGLPLHSQVTASLQGTVTDDSGLAVVDATVTALNSSTNERRTTQTNATGNYSLPALPVGTYTVQCELQGFRTWVQQGIELTLNRNARVDVRLAVGSVSEKITVVEDAPLVDTSSAEMGALVDQRRIRELPLNGRNSLSLVSLVAGAQELRTGNAQGFPEHRVSINGGRPEQNNWLLDGGDNTSTLRNYGSVVPNPDAVQEFKVMTSNYDAEYGRSAGAVVNVVTRSGSNEFHGTAAEFLRNRRLNSRNAFERDTTPLVQNQFGGTFGGPISRNRTFFFSSFEATRIRRQDFRNSALVPTQAERDGDFSRSVFSGKSMSVIDPLTGVPFPNNVIPQPRLSPVALNFLKLAVPLPNDPANGVNRLYQRAGEPSDASQFLVKIDHNLSNNHKLSGAYFINDSLEVQRFVSELDFVSRNMKARQHNLNLHEYWTLGPTLLNHFRATYSRQVGDRKVLPDDVTLNDLGGKFSPLPSGPIMPPSFYVDGAFDASAVFGGAKIANHLTVGDTVDWIHGRHNLKFGVEGWSRRLFDTSSDPAMGGYFELDGQYTGYGITDMLLGQATLLDVANESYKSNNSWAFYGFVQDKIRLTKRLTLDLGLRYELNTWPAHPSDDLVAFLPGRQSTCVPQAPAGIVFPCDPGVPRAGAEGDYNDFAPRAAIAFDLTGDGKTVIRAGYGIYTAFTIYNMLQGNQISTPFRYYQTINDTTLADPLAPIGGSPFPFRKDRNLLEFPNGSNYSFLDFNARNGYVQQYNFSVQRQFGKDWSAEVAYVGNAGRKLTGGQDLNAPVAGPNATSSNINQRRPYWPVFRSLSVASGFVNSSYNALQARLEKRLGQGLTVLASYTAGRAIDESSWHDSGPEWTDMRNRKLNRGRSDFDRAQTASISYVWQVPFTSRFKGVAGAILDGWEASGIATFYSGLPVGVFSGRDNDFDGNTANDKPDVVGEWMLDPNRPRQEVIQKWFDPAAFVVNPRGRIGTLGRNVVNGPGFKSIDLSIGKQFRITEQKYLQFRAEAFNAMNWVNLSNPEGRLSRATFGRISSAQSPRILQFGLKFAF
jgi:hypothetical protein